MSNQQLSPVPAPISMAVTPSKLDDEKLLCKTKSANSKAAFQTCTPVTTMNHTRTWQKSTIDLFPTWSPTLLSELVTPCWIVSRWQSVLTAGQESLNEKLANHNNTIRSNQQLVYHICFFFSSGPERDPHPHPRRLRQVNHLLKRAKHVTPANN